jgi:hypothetical protein
MLTYHFHRSLRLTTEFADTYILTRKSLTTLPDTLDTLISLSYPGAWNLDQGICTAQAICHIIAIHQSYCQNTDSDRGFSGPARGTSIQFEDQNGRILYERIARVFSRQ